MVAGKLKTRDSNESQEGAICQREVAAFFLDAGEAERKEVWVLFLTAAFFLRFVQLLQRVQQFLWSEDMSGACSGVERQKRDITIAKKKGQGSSYPSTGLTLETQDGLKWG